VLSCESAVLPCALARLLELAIPLDLLGLKTGEKLQLALTLTHGGELLERYPSQGAFELTVSATDLEAQMWSV
jgi:hypothetical protein